MEAIITASLGAMSSLPSKLDRLLSERKLVLHNGEKSNLCILKSDLEVLIEKYLMKPLSEVGDPAFTTNYWLKEVRELSYDIDDFADKLLHGVATAAADAKNFKVPRLNASKFLGQKRPKIGKPLVRLVVPSLIAAASAMVDAKMASRQDQKKRLWIAGEVSRFRARIKEVIRLHKSYIKSVVSQPGWRSMALPLAKETDRDLVGIDKNMDELSGWLVDDGQLECKVIAIVGPGGVGKTTLAKELFQKFGWQFECQAFIRASRKPNMKRVLSNILTQVGHHRPPINLEVDNLVDEIKSYLKDKRYFIIIDDVWALSTWDTINRALPRSNCSRILTTTEVYHVAQISCADNSKYIFKKEPLDEDESNELFLRRGFSHKTKRVEHLKEISSEITQHVEHLEEISSEITQLCGGLPLAIVATASILARLPDSIELWTDIKNSLGSNLGTEQVLNLVYNTLPYPLKACMLHLSIYEEDYIILKDDLLKQWVDEGFIGTMDGNDKEEVAMSYFYEFVNMGMIQPVQISSNDEVLSCTTHYMVLDFIRHKSIEENFSIAIDHSQLAIRLTNKIRRLSLHFGNGEDATMPTYLRLSQVRTLAFFGLFNYPLPIGEFRLLQVLILQLSVGHDDISYDLTEISELFRLRYLYISACHLNIKLPIQMQWLKDLVTLKIEAKLNTVPSDIVDLPRILHLYLPSEANLPHDIDHMTSLRTLGYFDLSSNSGKIIMNLGKLTNLQDLYLTCSKSQLDTLKDKMKCLCSFLEKLKKLRSLTLVCTGSSYGITTDKIDASSTGISCDDFSVISPPPFLRRFELSRRSCILAHLPKWIKELANLRILKIAVSKLSRHDIHILSELPTLAIISLYIQTALEEMIVFGNAGFSNLRCFKFRCSVPWLKFEANAMPSLQKLKLKFNASFNLYRSDTDGTKSISIEHLSGLKEIFAKVGNADASVEPDLMATISNDPSNPTITFQMVDNIFYGDTSNGMRTKHDKGSTLGQQDTIVEEGPTESYRTKDDVEEKDEKREVDDSRISMVEGLCLNPSSPLPQRRSGENIPWLLPVCGGVWPTSKVAIVGHDHVNCHTGNLSIAATQANYSLNYQSRVESSQALGTMIGIFDGYGGCEAAKFACDHLLPHLQDIMSSSQGATIDAISKAFKATEEGFIEDVSHKWKTNPQMATTGSCCLVGIMQQKTLFIANLGNSRAVLGKVSCTGEISAEQLSSEHIASDAGIRHELMVAHPDDPDIVVHTQSGWRVKGIIKVSRSIGDAYLKHPEYNVEPSQSSFTLSRPFRSPILSANPSIVSRNLQPSDRFIIFASAGLWEYLSHQEAVEIVRNHQRSGSAKRLIKIALCAAAKKHNLRYSDLLKTDRDDHRHLYDHMTVVVLFIGHDQLRKGGQGQPLSIRIPLEN